jgi:paraquat-inducible protein B
MRVNKIPVIIQIDLEKLSSRGVTGVDTINAETFNELINQGLRGQLQTESLVTGVLYVGVDFFPGHR